MTTMNNDDNTPNEDQNPPEQKQDVSGFYESTEVKKTEGFSQQKQEETTNPNEGDKTKTLSIILSIVPTLFTSGLVHGIHRLYLGYTLIGIIQLLTLGGCGIWTLIDIILLATDKLKPADGKDWNSKSDF